MLNVRPSTTTISGVDSRPLGNERSVRWKRPFSKVFVPRDFEVFVGLDVDKKRIVGTFRDHGSLLLPPGTGTAGVDSVSDDDTRHWLDRGQPSGGAAGDWLS
jgi:hypothetical protein